MREIDRAVGRLAACCSAMGADFSGYHDQNDQKLLDVHHRGDLFTVTESNTGAYFTAVNVRRLTNIENFPLQESVPIVELDDDAIVSGKERRDTSNIVLELVTETKENDSIEYFDGYRATRPLFAYDDEFGAKEFDNELAEMKQVVESAFLESLDKLGIDIDIEETASSDDDTEPSGVAFQ